MTDMTTITSKLNRKFSDLGRTNGTAPLPDSENRAALAHELFVANQLRGLADKRYEAAKKDALDAGILGDFTAFEPGLHATYDSDHVAISVRKNSSSESVDKKALEQYLAKELPKYAAAIMKACTKERAGQTVIQIATKS